jgi:protein-S-isoprenylcysteine O-methyltransferase Ste14
MYTIVELSFWGKVMSLIPAFELGLWNAWIFTVPSLLLMIYFFRLANEKRAPSPTNVRLSKTKMSFCLFSKLIYFLAFIYSIFLPLKLGTVWFYLGLPITLIGLVTLWYVMVNWANTPAGEPITRGLYRYSRHPMYVTEVLFLLGVSIASASWVFFLFPLIVGVGAAYFIRMEEACTLGHYGKVYREYMNRTPRWIGIPKSNEK